MGHSGYRVVSGRKATPVGSMCRIGLVLIASSLSSWCAKNGAAAVQSYFTGKQVTVKIDMPGTQKGVDLRFNKPTPLDWKEYSSRLKQVGPAIHKGDVARVTSIVVKKDMIEFQLDGGGFGTFGDDTSTTVQPKVLDKSDYEKQLEDQIANTDDPDRKAQLCQSLLHGAIRPGKRVVLARGSSLPGCPSPSALRRDKWRLKTTRTQLISTHISDLEAE